jgi:hypothetical protein
LAIKTFAISVVTFVSFTVRVLKLGETNTAVALPRAKSKLNQKKWQAHQKITHWNHYAALCKLFG